MLDQIMAHKLFSLLPVNLCFGVFVSYLIKSYNYIIVSNIYLKVKQ